MELFGISRLVWSKNKLVECRHDSLPILVNLKSNTIMKKPRCKYKKDIKAIQIISIENQIEFICVKLIVVIYSKGTSIPVIFLYKSSAYTSVIPDTKSITDCILSVRLSAYILYCSGTRLSNIVE